MILQNFGYSGAFIIDPIEKLEPEELEWSDTKTLISSFISSVRNKI